MRKIYSLIILISVISGISSLAYCGFVDLGAGARPPGMGHAFTGVANDVNAIYYNPAGLVNITGMEFCFMYAPLMVGLTDGSGISDFYGAFAMKLTEESAIGAAWTGRSLNGPGYTENESLYNENTFYGTYAMWLVERLIVGASIKIPVHAYGEDEYTKNSVDNNGNVTPGKKDPVFNQGYSKIGFSADLGALYQLSDAISLGLMIQNLFSTNLALNPDYRNAYDPAPLYIRAGVGYRIPKLAIMENITIASDATYHIGGMKNDLKVHSGFESWLFERTIACRAGFGIGTNSYSDLSFGGSYVMTGAPEIQIDYAWVCPLSGLRTGGNHRFSCTLRL